MFLIFKLVREKKVYYFLVWFWFNLFLYVMLYYGFIYLVCIIYFKGKIWINEIVYIKKEFNLIRLLEIILGYIDE